MKDILATFAAYSSGSYNNSLITPSVEPTISEGWLVAASLLGVVGAVLIYFLFIKSKETPKSKFLAWLKNFLDFKILWIEDILKMLYYFFTIYIIVISFSFISIDGGLFLGTLVLGPILIRLIYEVIMLLVLIWKNTRGIDHNSGKIAAAMDEVSDIARPMNRLVKDAKKTASSTRATIAKTVSGAKQAFDDTKDAAEAVAKNVKTSAEEGIKAAKKDAKAKIDEVSSEMKQRIDDATEAIDKED